MSLNQFIACPEDCETALPLPVLPTNQDCINWDLEYSQLCELLIVPPGAPDPLDWTDPAVPAATSDSIDNSVNDDSKSKRLVGKGSVSETNQIVTTYPKRKSKVTSREFTVDFRVDRVDDETWAFASTLQCGDTSRNFYYANVSNYIFGKQGGITMKSIDVRRPQEGDDESRMFIQILIVFEATTDPNRFTNPYA